jgi:hypothetical protein
MEFNEDSKSRSGKKEESPERDLKTMQAKHSGREVIGEEER